MIDKHINNNTDNHSRNDAPRRRRGVPARIVAPAPRLRARTARPQLHRRLYALLSYSCLQPTSV